jgi:hypothetical protein
MYPKIICERYECTLGSDVDIVVLGMVEGEKAKISNEYMALIMAPNEAPEQLQADSFDDIVTELAKAFDETEETVRTALAASADEQKRSQAIKPEKSFLGSLRRKISGRR